MKIGVKMYFPSYRMCKKAIEHLKRELVAGRAGPAGAASRPSRAGPAGRALLAGPAGDYT